MLRIAVFGAMVCLAITLLALSGFGGGPLKVAVRPAKAEFVEGEPIGIEITISNSGDADVMVSFDYPFLRPYHNDGFRINAKAAGLTVRHKEQDTIVGVIHGIFPSMTISAGESLTTTIYLQRQVLQPEPGEYRVPYTLSIARSATALDKRPRSIEAEGVLRFTVVPAEPGQLMGVLRGLAKGLGEHDAWKEWEAVEALSVVDDPIILPFLTWMLEIFGLEEHGLRALERFPHEEQARAAVIETLRADSHSLAVQALRILKDWEYELEVEEIASLLERENPYVTKNVLDYLLSMEDRPYEDLAPTITKLLHRDDPSLIAQALNVLNQWGRLSDDDAQRARSRVVGLLRSEDDTIVIKALGLVTNWRIDLDEEVVDSLRESEDGLIRRMTTDYLRSMGKVDVPRSLTRPIPPDSIP